MQRISRVAVRVKVSLIEMRENERIEVLEVVLGKAGCAWSARSTTIVIASLSSYEWSPESNEQCQAC